MSTEARVSTGSATGGRGVAALYAGNARSVVGRGLLATKSTNWVVVLTGFVEPIFYLLSLGVGLGAYVGTVQDASGTAIPYAAYIAPALLAVSAMNGRSTTPRGTSSSR